MSFTDAVINAVLPVLAGGRRLYGEQVLVKYGIDVYEWSGAFTR